MPTGKPAGVRCVQLTADLRCALFGQPDRPAVCSAFSAERSVCGDNREAALVLLGELEQASRPARSD